MDQGNKIRGESGPRGKPAPAVEDTQGPEGTPEVTIPLHIEIFYNEGKINITKDGIKSEGKLLGVDYFIKGNYIRISQNKSNVRRKLDIKWHYPEQSYILRSLKIHSNGEFFLQMKLHEFCEMAFRGNGKIKMGSGDSDSHLNMISYDNFHIDGGENNIGIMRCYFHDKSKLENLNIIHYAELFAFDNSFLFLSLRDACMRNIRSSQYAKIQNSQEDKKEDNLVSLG